MRAMGFNVFMLDSRRVYVGTPARVVPGGPNQNTSRMQMLLARHCDVKVWCTGQPMAAKEAGENRPIYLTQPHNLYGAPHHIKANHAAWCTGRRFQMRPHGIYGLQHTDARGLAPARYLGPATHRRTWVSARTVSRACNTQTHVG